MCPDDGALSSIWHTAAADEPFAESAACPHASGSTWQPDLFRNSGLTALGEIAE